MKKLVLYTLIVGLLGSVTARAEGRNLEDRFASADAGGQRASCAAGLIKFGMALSLTTRSKEAFQLLYRGYAFDETTRGANPEGNADAWHASVNMKSSGFRAMLSRCVDLYNEDYKTGEIGKETQDNAVRKANSVLVSQ